MLKWFNTQWDQASTCIVDTETTGIRPGVDRIVQFGVARFENGSCREGFSCLVDPGIPIPPEATAVHGVTDQMVKGERSIEQALEDAAPMLKDCQLGAFNESFDKAFLPSIGDHQWPWIDPLVLVRKLNRYASGKGRHKLSVSCARHGIVLTDAHDAKADAIAAGELFYKLGWSAFPKEYTMGRLLAWQQQQAIQEWTRFNTWLAAQPPLETTDSTKKET